MIALNRRRIIGKKGEVPLEKQYLTFEALESGTFQFSKAINYSLDGGRTWVALEAATDTPTLSVGDKILWKATLTPTTSDGIGTFSSTGRYNAFGNPLSLRSGDNFKGVTTMPNNRNMFFKLFNGSTGLVSVEDMSLVCTNTRNSCYQSMFYGCTSLTTAMAELPATTGTSDCYRYMFRGCTALTTAPNVKLTSVDIQSCEAMFMGCTALVNAPTLSFTSIGKSGCYQMFKNCTSMVTAPSLNNVTLSDSYNYREMFMGCTSLVNAPALASTTVVYGCYWSMFEGCTSLINAPELPANTLATYSYLSMFSGCTNLQYIKCLAITKTASGCLSNWVKSVPSGGTFVKHPDASWSTGNSGIPTGWTVQDATIS